MSESNRVPGSRERDQGRTNPEKALTPRERSLVGVFEENKPRSTEVVQPATDNSESSKKIDKVRQKAYNKAKKNKERGKGGKKGKNKLKRFTKSEQWTPAPKEVKPEKPPFLSLDVSPRRMGIEIVGATSALAYLGYKVVEETASASATLSDRLLKKVADIGEGLIDKKLPGMKWLDKMMGKVEKKLGLDKLFIDVIQKDQKARQKLLDKLLKDESTEIKQHKNKKKQKKSKAKQQKQWAEMFGEDGAAILAKARDDGEASVDVPEPAAEPEKKAA